MLSDDFSVGSVQTRSNLKSVDDPPRDVKVVTVGESGVGKTSLTLRFVNNSFRDNVIATIGASFLTKTLHIKNSQHSHIRFNIWDTAGQEKYRSLASLYYRGVDCAIICYDITNRNSFEEVQSYWMQELKHQCFGDGGLQLCLVGNKADLTEKRQVSTEEGRDLAYDFGATFFESSAKTDMNVSEIFTALASDLPDCDRSISTNSNSNLYKVHIPDRKSICC